MNVVCNVLTSTGLIPSRFAYTGVPGSRNDSLPLQWSGPPDGTASFAVTVIDIHPVANNWVHWCVVNIPPLARSMPEGASGVAGRLPEGCVELNNTFGTGGYGGPKPPKGSGPHEYVITVHALSVPSLDAAPGGDPGPVLKTLEKVTLARGVVVGVFEQ